MKKLKTIDIPTPTYICLQNIPKLPGHTYPTIFPDTPISQQCIFLQHRTHLPQCEKLPIASLDRCTRCWFWSNSDAIIFVLHIISLTCSDVILYHTSNYQITKITWMFLTLSPDQAFFLENYRINDEMAINIYLPHNFTRKSRPYKVSCFSCPECRFK